MRIDNRQLFDFGAGVYTWMTLQPTWREHCRDVVRTLAADGHTPPTHVLDLGVGPGVSAFAVHDVFPGCHCTGVDISGRMLQRAGVLAEKEAGSVDLVLANAEELPFEDDSFDALLAHSFFYLLPDSPKVFREAARVLRSGARLALLEPRDGGSLSRLLAVNPTRLRFMMSMAGWRVASRNFGRWKGPDLIGALEDAGFSDLNAEPCLEGMGWLVTGRLG
ncbi:MAG: ubiquinone/menaquinone biosynthesis C-methylase UbiE [Kiritimatiellia bacterium]